MEFPTLVLFTDIASTEGFLVACAILLVIVYLHCGKWRALAFFGSALGLVASVQTLKEWLQVARPESALIEVTGYAFPSGHAAGAAFIALSVCHLMRHHSRRVRYAVYFASALLAVAIGVSRISFQVHTPFQVAAGFLIGIFWASLFIFVERAETRE